MSKESAVLEMKSAANQIFDAVLAGNLTISKKDLKFYQISGADMARLTLSFGCDPTDGSVNTCPGCEKCEDDRIAFAEEYNRLTHEFKENISSKIKLTVKAAINTKQKNY